MQSASANSFLDADGAGFTLHDIVEDHAPSAPPSELFLDPDDNLEEVAGVRFNLSFPLSSRHIGVQMSLDDLTR